MDEEIDLSEERKDRYLEKLDKISRRLQNIENWLSGGVEEISTNTERKLAIFKAFQESVESLSDICAMYVSDSDKSVGDDYENIKKASGYIFDQKYDPKLREANGLRNRLVHEYNKFSDRTALESIEELVETIHKFESEVREWIKRK